MREVELRGAIHRHLEVTVGPTADGSAWVLVFHDVTETKRLERVRTDFVANVSHELRTPLTAIKGFAETLRLERLCGSRARGALRLDHRPPGGAAQPADRRPAHPERPRARQDAGAGAAGGACADRPRGRGPAVGAGAARRRSICRSTCRPSCACRAIPDRLTQVVSNLLDNAIKYTPGGGQRAHRRPAGEPGSPLVELAVEDTGAGIPAEDLPRLAERFYRVDKARDARARRDRARPVDRQAYRAGARRHAALRRAASAWARR